MTEYNELCDVCERRGWHVELWTGPLLKSRNARNQIYEYRVVNKVVLSDGQKPLAVSKCAGVQNRDAAARGLLELLRQSPA